MGLIHTTMYETENQSDPVVQHRELYSVLCSDLYRKRALKRVHICVQVSSVQSLSCVRLFVTPWTAARQDSPSVTNSWSLLKLMSIESVMPPNHLILCHPLLLPIQSFPASGSFPMSWFFASDGQSIGVSASTSVFPMNIQD